MQLIIKNGFQRVVVTSGKGRTILHFEHPVSVDICEFVPFDRKCIIENVQKENFRMSGHMTTDLCLPNFVDKIAVHCHNLDLCIRENSAYHPSFSVENMGSQNTIAFKDNNFKEIVILDNYGDGRFDLSEQCVQELKISQGEKTILMTKTSSPPTCFVCQSESATRIMQPCGHWGLCNICATQSSYKTCPICQSVTGSILKIWVV